MNHTPYRKIITSLNVGGLYEIVQEGVKKCKVIGKHLLLLEKISTGQKASLLWAIGSGRFVQYYWVVFADSS